MALEVQYFANQKLDNRNYIDIYVLFHFSGRSYSAKIINKSKYSLISTVKEFRAEILLVFNLNFGLVKDCQ